MGREIKRVPLDFDWPLRKTWEGFVNPHYDHRRSCPFCDGSGYNAGTKLISDSWCPDHDFIYYRRKPRWEPWRGKFTQEEVDLLVSNDYLRDLTHIFVPGARKPAERWKRRPDLGGPTAEDVNALVQNEPHNIGVLEGGSRYILTKHRAKKAGVYGMCEHCGGDGNVWRTLKDKEKMEAWEETPLPKGAGWQYWENVSEGSPLSPVFEHPDDLAEWLVENDEASSFEAAQKFVKAGWAPSAVSFVNKDGEGAFVRGVDALSVGDNTKDTKATVNEGRFGMLDTSND